jgi:hypothetical protein
LPVTGFNSEDARDAAASLFTTATHSGISFTYNDTADTLAATVNLSNYNGVIKASSFNGSVVADDSTLLVDATSGRIVGPVFANVTGTVTGNIFTTLIDSPDSSAITVTPSAIFSSNVTVEGELIIRGNLVVDNGNGDITVTGGISSSRFSGNLLSDVIYTSSTTEEGLDIYTTVGNGINFLGYNGTAESPTTTAAGDFVGTWTIKGYANTIYKVAGAFNAQWDATANLSDDYPKSSISLIAGAGGGDTQFATFNGDGIFNAPVVQTAVYSAAGTPLPSAVTVGRGARAFVSDATATTFASTYSSGGSNSVPVYSDGTNWKIG